ncbi:MAG: hypothetical protein AAFX44_20060 [Pseudomonadota bacterium]
MPRARKHLVCVDDTPYYHVVSRCVRRAFLCGEDAVTGKSFEHRRGWIEDRVRVLSSLFSVELCAFAIMSNHYHLVVRLAPDEAGSWTDEDVLRRWTTLFRGPLLVQRFCDGDDLSAVETETLQAITAIYRKRLASLSWFMKCLNEPIARQANAEDRCTGHFWEARFRSQALRTEQALMAAMAYVDLNPVRARIARTPEGSDYTSVQARIKHGDSTNPVKDTVARLLIRNEIRRAPPSLRPLAPFADAASKLDTPALSLPMRWTDYLQLVDTTGRIAVLGKRGCIDPALEPVLNRLGLTTKQWQSASTQFQEHFRNGELRIAQSG